MNAFYRVGFLFALAMCFASSALSVSAQESKSPGVPAPPNNSTATEAKKANPRSSATTVATRGEPFDKASIEKMASQCVTLETAMGKIVAEMYAESSPETVRNFLNLAATGAFDTTTFSRVVKDFVVQGGNLATREVLTEELARRAVRTIPDEPGNIKHTRGILSMARSAKPNSATTSFFILVADAPHLDGTFTAFGSVVQGMDIVDAINHAALEGEKPVKPVRVVRAVVMPCPKDLKQTIEPQS